MLGEGRGVRGERRETGLEEEEREAGFSMQRIPGTLCGGWWIQILAPTLFLYPLRKSLSFPTVAGTKPRRLADAGVQEPHYTLRAVIWD